MDSNTGFIWNPSALHSDHADFIDLGLSLRTLDPEAYYPSAPDVSLEGYGDIVEWHQLKSSPESSEYPKTVPKVWREDEGAQSKERWAYVKVNMDGVMVGRKICMMPHLGGYSNLAHELEDMFGTQSESGLRLFQAGSQFSLFYMDRYNNWRTVGDVSWREFIDSVKRLRITPKSC